jgi:hypothetical protein
MFIFLNALMTASASCIILHHPSLDQFRQRGEERQEWDRTRNERKRDISTFPRKVHPERYSKGACQD